MTIMWVSFIPTTFADLETFLRSGTLEAVPVPSALWLLGSGLVGLVGCRMRMRR
jgi:hypothetical protein